MLLAMLANTVFKSSLAVVIGGAALARKVVPGMIAAVLPDWSWAGGWAKTRPWAPGAGVVRVRQPHCCGCHGATPKWATRW